MDKSEIIKVIEDFAPPELAECWDCSGWLIETEKKNINKIILALTVTSAIILQAKNNDCDMIISHHPMFSIPIEWKDIDIYCAHTNLDKIKGGTTDTLIKLLDLPESTFSRDFLRIVDFKTNINSFEKKLNKISQNVRVINNFNKTEIQKIAFCAGSGSEFVNEAAKLGADAFVTGDIKFHTAIESPIVLFDIGHFESEIPVLKVLSKIISDKAEVIYAQENSPFLQIKS